MTTGEIATLVGIAVGMLTIVGFVARQFGRVIDTKLSSYVDNVQTKLSSHVDNIHRQMDSHTRRLNAHLVSVDKQFDDFRDNHLNHIQKAIDSLNSQFTTQVGICSNHQQRTAKLEALMDSDRHNPHTGHQ